MLRLGTSLFDLLADWLLLGWSLVGCWPTCAWLTRAAAVPVLAIEVGVGAWLARTACDASAATLALAVEVGALWCEALAVGG